MAIDWEGLLEAEGAGLQRAYDDCVARAMEEESYLYDLSDDDDFDYAREDVKIKPDLSNHLKRRQQR